MTVSLVYDPAMAGYRLSATHPMKPERFTLAVDLMRQWGLLAESSFVADADAAAVVAPEPASQHDLLLVHDESLIEAVRRAGADPAMAEPGLGIGPGDTPAFARMHEVSSLIVGGTVRALGDVVDGAVRRSFSPAGGLHHAHRDRVAGFCVYNDCAVAIARATRDHPGLRVAYVDIDAHHGDGVQEVFYERSDVLTLSVHESGNYLYPGTGDLRDTGAGAGRGYALNVPLPPEAGPACYEAVTERVIAPALRAFGPDVVVVQSGADTHQDDPLTHLENTVLGFDRTMAALVALSDELCDGRIAITGGGGYEPYSAVPRMWACAMAELLGRPVPPLLPSEGLRLSREAARGPAAPRSLELTFAEATPPLPEDDAAIALGLTGRAIDALAATHPLLAR